MYLHKTLNGSIKSTLTVQDIYILTVIELINELKFVNDVSYEYVGNTILICYKNDKLKILFFDEKIVINYGFVAMQLSPETNSHNLFLKIVDLLNIPVDYYLIIDIVRAQLPIEVIEEVSKHLTVTHIIEECVGKETIFARLIERKL